ncbi:MULTISPECIES: excinuclease ABC subunit UvrC [unclassified Mycolicibacterium]|uniref:excinuclease ABC subunit UvrC n=3 Tax=Mycolicibacterium TaxID=1866885 RepID=UPI0013095107|nr:MULTISPECIES: excinuclease ABC subunit UvrC [unclassified Mycolicibacterium]MUL84470.1 excinuclease ABC subunit UvrC [Mycolicibacterium sp. CBMA 329]MUL88245.1 excinuclease ABC subunit UvrC [Mycolicibacterium sp. CBMA 331]MUL99306.1 excinuclease ABC subunit UvrC [Mycolicibacterium sp. CBMA 334]MUM39892.1 excinuclease ABC subunit UvrC [Mycolicibacterium sp. CBMA 247]MUM44310.1 excinuclease ABC subunit UvrC [Mycolicibacterium sp. CBMA 294]
MPDPATYRPAPGSIPVEPGVYRFRDPHGRVIYVGKAKSLRSRLTSYFADIASLAPRTRQMVMTAGSVEWTVVTTEVEALQLEYNWIKEFDPRFNIRYRDDKTYPVLAVTLNEEYPRLMVYRGPRRKGVRYFGPYSHAWAIRETLDLLTRVFPARTCSAGVFKRHRQIDRPCLLGYIDKCSAPCVGRVSAEEHRRIVLDFCDFLAGKTDRLARDMEQQMTAAAEALDFERAARLRDDIAALKRALEKQAVVLGDGTDADVVAFADDDLEAAVQVFHVRGGRVRGQRGWIVEKSGDPEQSGQEHLVEQFLTQFYGEQAELGGAADEATNPVPREVLVPVLPPNADELAAWLSGLRGSRVSLRVPVRGDKRTLAETVQRNAQEALAQHKLKRAGDFNARSEALQSIQDSLGLADAPLRIECVDISHVQGTDVVASLVVFEDGLPRKSDYRHYAIREAAGDGRSDDVASIAEVTRRRFLRHTADAQPEAGTEQRPRRFAYPPNLFVVDGGAPQVNAASAVLDELGVTDVAVIGLAKRLEEVWVPSEPDPVIFPRNSEGLYLLQRVRDEAHRFAISYHRSKRSKRMTASALDSVRGLGEQRRKALVTHFGSVARLKDATVEEITAVPGIGVATAKAVLAALGGEPPIEPGGEPPVGHGGEPPGGESGDRPSENSAGLGDSGAPATVIEDDRRRVSG